MARTGRARKHTHPIPKVETNNTTAGNVAEHIVHARTGDTTHKIRQEAPDQGAN